jgi:exodeoxyribonuclease V gamma subunit
MLKKTIVPSSTISSNQVFMSNNLIVLASILKEVLSQKEGSLRTIILIPSNHIKNFITQYLTETLGVCFGIRFLTIAQGIEHFIKLSYSDTFSFPSFANLSLHLESLLLNPTEKLIPLLDYLENDKKKISSLARELGHVFLHYGVYGGKALETWKKTEEFEQILWEKVSEFWNFPCEILKNTPKPKIRTNLILFNIPHIPLLYKNFFDDLSETWEISYFFKSPTPHYWGDILSDRALAKADIGFQKKSISETERENFEEIAADTNSLLANFGSLSKKDFLWLSEKETHELFLPPKETSSLSQIQSDIFYLRPMRKVDSDSSLQIHEAASPLREIEILLYNLQTILKDGTVLPEEITVLANDLDLYFPHIQFVFEKDTSPLGYAVSDLSMLEHNNTLKTIDLFFTAVEGRFDSQSIKDLIFSEPIASRQNFTAAEFSLLAQIIDEMNIEWGFDKDMKKEILGIDSVSERGSWKFAFDQLLTNLAYSSSIEISKYEMLGTLISFLEGLFTDFIYLKKRQETLANWIIILDELLNKYFLASEELEFILKEIHSFANLAKRIDSIFIFSSIHALLKEILAKKSFDRYYSRKPVIQFANLSEGASTNSKVVFLLGLDEDSFPRKRTVRSLNQLKGMPGCDPQPENSEKDRFYFLEAILSAKENLVISYTGLSPKDGKPLAPSLCIQELLYSFKKNPIIKHPNLEFYPELKQEIAFSIGEANPEPRAVDIRHLIELMKHPIRFYCNRVLGIFLERGEEKDSREFFLSYLDKAVIREAFLKQPEEDLLESLERKNLLPTALFKESAKAELLEELQEIHLGLKTFGLSKDDFFSIHFDIACKEPSFLDASRFLHPAIPVTLSDGRTFTLTGKLPSLSKQGIYIHKEASVAEIWKHLAHLAILNSIKTPTLPRLLFGKDLSTKASNFTLPALIEYYLEASLFPSPLLPEQIDKLLKKKLFSPTSFFEDPYLTFLAPDLSKNWDKWLTHLT